VRKSHKARLALVASGTSALVLAFLFAAIVLVAREVALRRWQSDMRTALHAIAIEPDAHFDTTEFREAHPDLSITIYDRKENLIRFAGPILSPAVDGFKKIDDQLHLGQLVKGERIVAGANWHQTEEGLRRLALVLTILWAPLALLVGGATWYTANAIFDPLIRLSAQAQTISGSNLNQRLATDDQAEFGDFARQLNAMLDRIEQTAKREEQFAADAAHELRTPLSILRTRIETTLLRPRQPEEYAATSTLLLDEIDRLTKIVESLLETARGQSTRPPNLRLAPIVEEVCARWRTTGTSIATHTARVSAAITPEELSIVLDNLLENAQRYAPADSEIVVILAAEGDFARLAVRDAGPGIPEPDREAVFDRFVRLDPHRNRSSGGAGIGLSVCQKIVASRQGHIEANSVEPQGTEIIVRLPLQA